MTEAGLHFAVSLAGGIKLFKDVNILLGRSESARERSLSVVQKRSISQSNIG